MEPVLLVPPLDELLFVVATEVELVGCAAANELEVAVAISVVRVIEGGHGIPDGTGRGLGFC